MRTTRVVHVNDKIDGAVYIGRQMWSQRLVGSALANPFRIGRDGSRQAVIKHYRDWLRANPKLLANLPRLRGKPLACWCRHDGEDRTPGNACHGDVLIELLDRYTDDELRAMGGAM